MRDRRRWVTDTPGAPCQLCSGATLVARSRARRRGGAWLNPRWDPDVRTYELCQGCGAKRRMDEDQPA